MYHLRPCEYVLRGVSSLGVSTRVIGSFRSSLSLENNPPVPTLQPGHNPLHRFLGFNPNNHLLSISARDPNDAREMPPNGNSHMSVNTLQGVRKVRQLFCTFMIIDSDTLLSLVISHRLAFTYPRVSTRYRLFSFRYPFHESSIFSKKTYKEHRTFIRMVI